MVQRSMPGARGASGTTQQVVRTGNYIGYSTSTKPTLAANEYGIEFYELNTGKNWIWDGTYWVEDLSLIYAVQAALNF